MIDWSASSKFSGFAGHENPGIFFANSEPEQLDP